MFITFINPFNFPVSITGSFTNNKTIPIEQLKCIELSDGIHLFKYVNESGDLILSPNKVTINDNETLWHYINIKYDKYVTEDLESAFKLGDIHLMGAYYLQKYTELETEKQPFNKDLIDKAQPYLAFNIQYKCVYSLYQLGLIYKNIHKDIAVAMKLFERASNEGHSDAKKIVDEYNIQQQQLQLAEKIKLEGYIELAKLGDIRSVNYLIHHYKIKGDLIESGRWQMVLNTT